MQTISTKYLGPTNFRGSRIKAKTSSGLSKTYEWDHRLDSRENHMLAALMLKDHLKWTGDMVVGDTNTGIVCVFESGDRLSSVVRDVSV